MLENMWDTSGVWWICLEADAEDIIAIVPCHMQIVCARLFMLEVQRREFQLGNMLCALKSEAVEMFAGFGEVAQICDGSI